MRVLLRIVCCLSVAGCQEIRETPIPMMPDRPSIEGALDAGQADIFLAVDGMVHLADAHLPLFDVGLDPDQNIPDLALPKPFCPMSWTRVDEGSPASCMGRQVVDLAAPTDPRSVAIARSGEGRLAVGWSDLVSFDQGSYVLRVLNGDSLVVEHESLIEGFAFGDLEGNDSALSVLRETFHLVTWLRSDGPSAINYRQLRSDGVLSAVEVVSGLVGVEGRVAVVAGEDGSVHVGWHDPGSLRHRFRKRLPDQTWEETQTIGHDDGDETPGHGAISLALGEAGQVHAAFQVRSSLFGAKPASTSRVGQAWNDQRTLDAHANRRLSGIEIELVARGDQLRAVYGDWVGGTAEIRLASWNAGQLGVEVETIAAGLAMPDAPSLLPLALDQDDAGHLHLVVLVSRAGASALEYYRQVGGSWVVEVIDDHVPSADEDGFRLDMTVEGGGRIHVIYADPTSGMVHYATNR